MFNRETWIEIAHTVTVNPLRTALTGLSVGLGIFILVVMQGLGFGLQNGVEQDFGDEAKNTIWVRTGTTTLAYRGRQPNRYIELRDEDEERVTEQVVETPAASGRLSMWGSTVQYKNEQGNYPLMGVEPDFAELDLIPLQGGRWLHQDDLEKESKVCVIGENVINELFKQRSPIGEYIILRGITFRVVGHFTKNGRWGNSMVYIPMTTMQRLFQGNDAIGSMVLSTGDRDLAGSTAMVDAIDGDLRLRHAVHPRTNARAGPGQPGGIRHVRPDFQGHPALHLGHRRLHAARGGHWGGQHHGDRGQGADRGDCGCESPGRDVRQHLVFDRHRGHCLTLISGALGLIADVATLNYAAPMPSTITSPIQKSTCGSRSRP